MEFMVDHRRSCKQHVSVLQRSSGAVLDIMEWLCNVAAAVDPVQGTSRYRKDNTITINAYASTSIATKALAKGFCHYRLEMYCTRRHNFTMTLCLKTLWSEHHFMQNAYQVLHYRGDL